MKIKKTIASLLICGAVMGSMGVTASARYIREFANISAVVGTDTKVSNNPLMKCGSTNAVFNYSGGNSSGDSSLVTATIRNSDNAYRGSCSADKGERKVFSTSASINYYYDLYVSKTYSGSSILVSGSWSPDEE